MEPSISAEGAALALSYGERLVKAMAGWGKGALKSFKSDVQFLTKEAHVSYAESLIRRYACLKTFFIRSEPVPLYDFYVPAGLSFEDEKTIRSAGVEDVLRHSTQVVISGVGGAGKTIFMRHLLLDSLNKLNKIPVFVELRELSGQMDDIHEVVFKSLLENGLKITRDFYDRLVLDGSIIYLLDGFDEIQLDSRKLLEKKIIGLARKTECALIVSSRPDSRFDAWPEFSVAEIADLSLADACKLIKKVPFDDGTKEKFTQELRARLFNKHRSMLSNPLLLSIMLLTYSESASIPNRVTTFYQLAYEALFHRHDALKFGFQRSRKTDLDINQFSKIFSALCLVTYDDRKFKFDLNYALNAVERACRISNISVDARSFVDDAREAVCLFVEDGLELSFTHRSFQEYFAAKFISSVAGDRQKKLLSKYAKSEESLQFDNVLGLLYELNPQIVEKYWLIPELKSIYSGRALSTHVTYRTWFLAVSKSFDALELTPQQIVITTKSSASLSNAIIFVSRVCVGRADMQKSREAPDMLSSEAFLEKYRSRGVSEIRLKDHSATSAIMKDLSLVVSPHSRRSLELIRLAFLMMLQREADRDEELDTIFLSSDA